MIFTFYKLKLRINQIIQMNLLDTLWTGNGAALFPFLNCTDLSEIRVVSKEAHIICKKAAMHVTFYGIALPKQPSTVYDIFYGRYDSLAQRLQDCEDFTIHSMYFNRINPSESPTTLTRGATKFNKQWHGLVLMEIAYMLRDETVIRLLEAYQRNTCHSIRSFSSTYGYVSIRLSERFSEEGIKRALMSLRPPMSLCPPMTQTIAVQLK